MADAAPAGGRGGFRGGFGGGGAGGPGGGRGGRGGRGRGNMLFLLHLVHIFFSLMFYHSKFIFLQLLNCFASSSLFQNGLFHLLDLSIVLK